MIKYSNDIGFVVSFEKLSKSKKNKLFLPPLLLILLNLC